jgi:hypothetical protein
MIPKTMIRNAVREALNMAAGFGKNERMLHYMVNTITGDKIPLQDLRDAMDYNLSEHYIRSKEDKDADEVLWYLTPEGRAKLNLE